VSTIPLDDLAGMIEGTHLFRPMSRLSYLNIVFAFCRVRGTNPLDTGWTWIPDPAIPFYRLSAMSTYHPRHAPAGHTGFCLEKTLQPTEESARASDKDWADAAAKFLRNAFGVKSGDIVGIDVERARAAYPSFTKTNAAIMSQFLNRPFRPGEILHDFKSCVENLGLAGRAGTFVYLLTPEALISGFEAGKRACAYLGRPFRA
jgi:protoporphyrinogen oxidase